MSSSITSLALDIAAKESVAAAKLYLAPLAKFAKSFTEAEGEVGSVVKVPVFDNSVAAEFAAGTNDYTTATTAGVAGKSIELNKHPWASRRLLPDDDMETAAGKDWVKQTTVATVKGVAKAVTAEVLLTALNEGTGTLTLTGTTAIKKVESARVAAIAAGMNPEECTLLLPSAMYSALLSELPVNIIGASEALVNGSVERLFGFGYICELRDDVANTTHTLNAAVIGNDALAYAVRLPTVMNPDLFEVSDIVEDGVAIRVRSTGTNATDARYLGAEVIFGAKALKPAEMLIAKTAKQGT